MLDSERALPTPAPLSATLFNGALWMFGMRWTIRLVGLVSVTVLARLLSPADFGLVAIAGSLAAFPTAILEFGVETAIIRERSPSPGIYNTAWTIRVMQMSFAALCILIASPWLASAYGDPRLADMLRVFALILVLQGLENTWIASFRRNLNFRFEFAYYSMVKLTTAIMGIVLAFMLRSYWALVYAQLAGSFFRLALSFTVAPQFPRPSLSEWRNLWSFSKWSLVRSLGDYAVANADRLILGRVIGAQSIGAYTLGRELADLPISEISAPVNRALGPGIAKLQGERERLAQALVTVMGALATVTFPIGIGLAAVSDGLIPILLGAAWTAAIPVVQILALASLLSAIYGVMGYTLVMIGFNHTAAITTWLRAFLLVLVGIPASLMSGANGMASAFLVAEAAGATTTVFLVHRYLPEFKFSRVIGALFRPGFSALAMLVAVLLVKLVEARTLAGYGSPVPLVGAQVVVGAATYSATLLALWQLSRRPNGIESMVLHRLRLLRGTA